ncbi:MAG TPA: glycosyltransferase family 4 protein [Vicinamibacterales bacterium]|nr:glycosyltransferase family 4 protein [Vicinamibacterales bacterium]
MAGREMSGRASVVYVVPDKLGGMMNIIANLLAHRHPDDLDYHAILTHNHLHTDARFAAPLAAGTQTTIEYSLPVENLHAVMRRVARAVPPGGGVYLAGDLLDLAVASTYDFGKAVIYMLHGDTEYYYDLAVKHDPIVHAFIAYSRRMYDELLARLPHRHETIFHLPYGVPLPAAIRQPAPGRLRVIYAGRFEQWQKGIFDLPEIDRALQAHGIDVLWTVAGAGPDEAELKARWAFNDRVRWLGALPTPELIARYAAQDVFILPTRHEGFPVALVEAMGAGVAPVVSDIPSGVPEVVDASNGLRVPVGDVRGYADAIASLDADRVRLDALSAAARRAVVARFDVRNRVADYQALYARWRDIYRPMTPGRHLQYGSRLDNPWIPNPVVRLVRTAIRAAR